MRLAMILCLRLVSVRPILMKNKPQYVHYLTKNPTFLWTRYFFSYKAFFRHVLSFSISVWSQPSRACYSIVIRWYLILSQRGRRLGKVHFYPNNYCQRVCLFFFLLFLFLIQWGSKGPDGRTRAKQLHVHGYRCSVGACARWWQQWQPQSPPRSYSRRTGQTTLMFSSTISPRIFSGFAFNGNRINTRKLITPLVFCSTRYSLLFRRTMASGGCESNGDKHKHTNRLVNSMSPYLLQHKHNPVDWWGMYFICTPEGVVSYVAL